MTKPNWKSRLQSQTLRGALVAAIMGVIRVGAVVLGVELNFGEIEFWIAATIYILAEGFGFGAVKIIWSGRMKANTTIMPWSEEKFVKPFTKKGNKT